MSKYKEVSERSMASDRLDMVVYKMCKQTWVANTCFLVEEEYGCYRVLDDCSRLGGDDAA